MNNGKSMKMWENVELFNLSQKKEKETACFQNKSIILKSFPREMNWLMNKPVYLGLSVLELSKIFMN